MSRNKVPKNRLSHSDESQHLSISIEEYCKLATKFASQEMYDEALNIYQKAIQQYPDDLFLKINISKMLEKKTRFERSFWKKNEHQIQKLRKDDDILCNHYIGLGDLYKKQKKISKSIEAYEFAKLRNPHWYLPYVKLGEIYYHQKSFKEALNELKKAKILNKLEERVYYLLGLIYYQKEEFNKALAHFVDSSILAGKTFKETPYHEDIRKAFDRSSIAKSQTINEYIHSRSAVFQKLMDIINRHKGQDVENIGAAHIREIIDRFQEKKLEEELIHRVEQLRRCILVQELSEQELFKLAVICTDIHLKKGDFIFQEHESGGHLFLIQKGKIKITRTLPVGERILATFGEGSYFGEMDFLDNLKRSSDAVALEKTALYRIDREELIVLFERQKIIAVKMLIVFWKTLAIRIRDANEMLKSFFEASPEQEPKPRESIEPRENRQVEVALQDKIDILREKGLSEKDLEILASLTKEELYHKDELVFAEGDMGDTLYFILDGRIRVCKNIPGIGEEAIAIMERGDFFGEMSLVDNSRRSADVRAHEGPVTVLTISKQMLNHILYADIEAAYDFLGILCRSLSRRLRTINDMICKWHVMSGGF